jgi:hypothetical protein
MKTTKKETKRNWFITIMSGMLAALFLYIGIGSIVVDSGNTGAADLYARFVISVLSFGVMGLMLRQVYYGSWTRFKNEILFNLVP